MDPQVNRQLRIASELFRLRGAITLLATTRAGEVVLLAERVIAAVQRGGTLLFAGNGGSAAMSQHLATEFVVKLKNLRRPFAAIALTSDSAILTAAANDIGFEYVFARQLEALGKSGDLLWLMSVGGVSPNLLRAVETARGMGIEVVALVGECRGPLHAAVPDALRVPSQDSSHVQELHLAVGHMVVAEVEAELAQSEAA